MPASLFDNNLSFLPAAEILAARDKVLIVLNSFKPKKDEINERKSENVLQRPDGRACHVRSCVDGSIWLDRELKMRSIAHELAAVAAVAGPTLTKQELETRAFLAEMDVVSAQINATPREQRMERSAAVLAMINTPADVEAIRAAYWTRVPMAARMVAVMSARIPKERASDALCKFNALERGRIWCEVAKLRANLEVVQKCMNGGRMPEPSGRVQ